MFQSSSQESRGYGHVINLFVTVPFSMPKNVYCLNGNIQDYDAQVSITFPKNYVFS